MLRGLVVLSLITIGLACGGATQGTSDGAAALGGDASSARQLNRANDGQTITVAVGQEIDITLQTIGPGEYATPQLSSPSVRLLDWGLSAGVQNPGGPTQLCQLVADSPGRSELTIAHTGMNPTFHLTIDVSAP